MMSPFGPTEDPLQRKDNYYTSENKIDLTQVLRLLNLQGYGPWEPHQIFLYFPKYILL